MTMTKKDYDTVAATIRGLDDMVGPGLREQIAERFADALVETNPRFDPWRFMDASLGRDSTDSAGRTVHYSDQDAQDRADVREYGSTHRMDDGSAR